MTASKPASNHPWRKPKARWTHNVQHIRLAFPPFTDANHHAKLVAFHQDLVDLLAKHDLPSDPSYTGFYRADADWDNIDQPKECVNSCDRGTNSDGVDNAP
jgi:hypothetical protein